MGDAKTQYLCRKKFEDLFFSNLADQFVKQAPSVTLIIFGH